ncbi:MAG: beta-lactamase family protein [Bacteroidales bacterium]|nr:beta-lactamase family protein [Bacteroidales bacterium]
MKKRKKRLIVLLVFLMITIVLILIKPRAPQPPNSVKTVAGLEAYLENLADFGIPPGMTLVVVKNDSIIYSKGFGWADMPKKIPATPETVYHWFSITKIATAIAILQLQEQGKLQLDDSVAKILPFFNVQYPSATSRAVSIRNLLNHSSGLPDPMFRLLRWIHYEGDPPVNQTALVKKVLPDYSKLIFEPGEDTKYSNFGYMVLGAIIEKLTNQSYENYIRQNILETLGMNHTDFVYTKEMEALEAAGTNPVFDFSALAVPFVKGSLGSGISGKNIWFKRFYNDQTPPSGLIGSATDAARLAMAYLNKGELNGWRILTEQSVTTMTRESHIKKKNKPDSNREQGIGWQVHNKDELMPEHTGGGLAFHTMMRLYPDKNLGFILFTNSTKREARRILNLAATLDW